ncbi:hypothetical protein DAI22_01g232600 [Oryza sativa Japonica Group]|nr:hypothetical protein DAI22_01g232600 [Oryza sativa Japonica Group]
MARIQSQHPRICEFGLSTAVSRAGDWWRRRRDSPGQRVPQPADEVRDSGRRTAHCCFICRAGVLSAGECRVAVGVDPLEVLDRLPDRGAVHQMNRREAGNSTRSTVRAPKLVAEAPTTNASATWFGTVVVIDNPLTDGPNLTSSRLVGRAQGMYVVAAGKDALSLMMAMNFVFAHDGPCNGSSLAVFGAMFSSLAAWPPAGRRRLLLAPRGAADARFPPPPAPPARSRV